MIFGRLKRWLLGSLRRQLTVGMVAMITVSIFLFIWNISSHQQAEQISSNSKQVIALSESVATSSAVWVVSRDYSGLQEIVQGVVRFPNLRHVIVLDPKGMVLANNDPTKIGLYLTDLPQNPNERVVQRTTSLISTTSPIMLSDKLVGWVRIDLDRAPFDATLAEMRRGGFVYLLIMTALSALLATLAGRYLTSRLYAIKKVADAVQAGVPDARVIMSGNDEAAILARQFNSMLDSLAQREAQLRSFYQLGLVGLTITSPEKGWIRVNDYLCKMLEYSEQELRGMTWAQLTHPEDIGVDVEQFNRMLVNEINGYSLEKRFISRLGRIIQTELVVGCIRKPDGKVDYVTAIVKDISERKKAEQQQRIAATAFESQEGILVTDANRLILRVNHAFTRITGYTIDEVIGQNPRLLSSGRHDAAFYAVMWESINTTGTWEGEIWDRRKNGEVYPEHLTITAVKDTNDDVTNYVATLTDISLSKAATERINQLAFYDPLTQLPNRRLLLNRLHQALASRSRSGKAGALMFIDLDNFKTLNDTLGHNIGDLLLQQVAQRMQTCVREGDTVSRLGGDEFVVLLEDLSKDTLEAAAQTKAISEKILAKLNQPYQLATHEYHSTTSIGIALLNDHNQTADELLKQADIAMYQAKKAGRNTLRFFDLQMQDTINERAALEGELHKALENRQFHLHYQIQVDSLHRPVGAEALIRWIHPERGSVSPAHFIPLAEETGLILPIGQWVMDTACAQIKTWQQKPQTCDLILSVNVSAKQFRQADFVNQVQATIQRHAINATCLKLELTESMLLEDINGIIATMNALKETGVQFSLDDFGTGYSSLQYIKRLPLNQLKIDQSFVRDIAVDSSDKAIVRTIIAMAHSLSLDVIAEGVETEDQRQLLLNMGCVHYQGYLFGKPVPIEQFDVLLKQG